MFSRSTLLATRRLGVVLCGFVAAIALGAGQAQAADVVVPLHAAHVGSTAAGFGEQDCSDFDPAPEPDQDGWHFVLPGQNSAFTGLTLSFNLDGGGVLIVDVPGSNGHIKESNPQHAYVYTPVGATLTGGIATGTSDGSPNDFVLSHTCPGDDEPTPSPSETPTPSPSETPSESPSMTPSESPAETPSGAPSQPGGVAGTQELPVTGIAATTMLLGGLLVLATGTGLVLVARRRGAKLGA